MGGLRPRDLGADAQARERRGSDTRSGSQHPQHCDIGCDRQVPRTFRTPGPTPGCREEEFQGPSVSWTWM